MAMDSCAASPPEKIWKVGALARRIRSLLEAEIGWIWLEGECSNVRPAASGHTYFTIKDEIGQIQAAFFRKDAAASRIQLHDGLKVQAFGQITAYEKSSQYQIIIRRIEEAGTGSLHAAFEKLKARLLAEGLFASERKRPLPLLPETIGIVTSPHGAALRDILTVLHRRFARRHILISPCRVQGAGAAEEIASAIEHLNEDGRADVILIARGGGSLEDLWAFNEEITARAIVASTIPVVSAIGHETDFTIADFVSDLRAPTPSAAAEVILRPRGEWLSELRHWQHRMQRSIQNRLREHQMQWKRAASSPLIRAPSHLVVLYRGRLTQVRVRMASTLTNRGIGIRKELETRHLSIGYRVRTHLAHERRELDDHANRLFRALQASLQKIRGTLERFTCQLRTLGPDSILNRGFSITTNALGKVIRDPRQVTPDMELITRLAKGRIYSNATRVTEGDEP